MTSEHALLLALRALVTTPGARGLADDAAVLEIGGEALVLTLDTMVEGVHFLPDDPPQDIAWKLLAVNVSDLSAKGARPLGCLYSHALGETEWDTAFLSGLAEASDHFAMPLLGGDTVRMPTGAPRSFSLTALGVGSSGLAVPSRSGAQVADRVWVSGTIGDAGLGLAMLTGRIEADEPYANALTQRYRRPDPEPHLGVALAPLVHAMMDVSDGLLIDAQRIATASNVAILLEAGAVPLSPELRAVAGEDMAARLTAMTAGDDYELLFTAPDAQSAIIEKIAADLGLVVTPIGWVAAGSGLTLQDGALPIPLPNHLGYQH
ncbi:thiamine-monophosphate kinase [Novosphingobium sp. Rr 2-17]|uniref:thiamine-phosphate kinase n=1 Tax=Novosphingobium sp. Rr 2-17 TaxID=555793 RepID=UPI0002698B7F|nr:thiamine-phosphate kinase [Novosphingobium sp. Rr 2-17]EIZ80595.1 thiamine-monophosphate kinase [Novosphingobium sp. Rr 2-17]